MITRQELIDAIEALAADVQNGCASLDEPAQHDRVAALLERLPVAEPAGSRPLAVCGVAPADLHRYVGYQFWTYAPTSDGNGNQRVTISAVRQEGNDWLIELVEFPGYHVVRNGVTDLWADVAPTLVLPKPPDLIDAEGDTWFWYEGYVIRTRVSRDPWTREEIDREHGPVREA